MHIGIVGLGQKGQDLAIRLHAKGHLVCGYDADFLKQKNTQEQIIEVSSSLKQLVQSVPTKRIILLTALEYLGENKLEILKNLLSIGDVVINMCESTDEEIRLRAQSLESVQIDLLDCAAIEAVEEESTITLISGNRFAFNFCETLFQDIFQENAYAYCGKVGAGQFIKEMHKKILTGSPTELESLLDRLKNNEYNIGIDKIARTLVRISPVYMQLFNSWPDNTKS